MTYETKYKTVAICKECGKEFIKKSASHLYCSKKCKERSYAKSLANNEEKEHTIYTHKCTYCGKSFETTNRRKYFCSTECNYLYRYGTNKRKRAYKKQEPKTSIKKSGRKKIESKRAQIAKLWDANDPECMEVVKFIKTIVPLDWVEINRAYLLELQENEKDANQGKYVRSNTITKHRL